MKKELICLIVLILFLIPGVSATTINATSCSYEDVSSAIDLAQSGDTVIVPAGTCTWNNQLVITKGIQLIGAGIGNTIIMSGYDAPYPGQTGNPINFLVHYQPQYPEFDEAFRLSGFEFNLLNRCWGLVVKNTGGVFNPPFTYPLRKIRIDHNKFLNASRAVQPMGTVWGVADNNLFENCGRIGSMWGSNGDTWSYHQYDFGTSDQFYFEDNVAMEITGTFFTSYAGARWCFRYNNLSGNRSGGFAPAFDAHGNQPGTNWAVQGVELYNNTITHILNQGIRLFDWRGGKNLAYNNNLITTYRCDQQIREEYHDTLGGTGTLYPHTNLISGQPQHISETYSWRNLRGTTLITSHIASTINYTDQNTLGYIEELAYRGLVPREDIHFFEEKINFNGSSGIGVGLISQRPATCTTEGVAWWATDEEKLYRCKNGAWELYYVPYIYPHPLIVAPFGTDICREGEIISECWCEGMKSLGYCYNGYYYTEEGERIPDIPPTLDIVTIQDMLGAYQQYKRNEVTLAYFLDKLKKWIVFW